MQDRAPDREIEPPEEGAPEAPAPKDEAGGVASPASMPEPPAPEPAELPTSEQPAFDIPPEAESAPAAASPAQLLVLELLIAPESLVPTSEPIPADPGPPVPTLPADEALEPRLEPWEREPRSPVAAADAPATAEPATSPHDPMLSERVQLEAPGDPAPEAQGHASAPAIEDAGPGPEDCEEPVHLETSPLQPPSVDDPAPSSQDDSLILSLGRLGPREQGHGLPIDREAEAGDLHASPPEDAERPPEAAAPQPRSSQLLERIPTVLPAQELRPLLLAPPVRMAPLPSSQEPAALAEPSPNIPPPPVTERPAAPPEPRAQAPAPAQESAPPPPRLQLVPQSEPVAASQGPLALARSFEPLIKRPQTPPPEALRRPAVPPPPDGYRARQPVRPPPALPFEPAPPPEAAGSARASPDAIAPSRTPLSRPRWDTSIQWRPLLRRAVLGAGLLAVALSVFVLGLVVLYRWVDPPASTLMVAQRLTGTPISQRWVPLDRMSTNLRLAVILSEDGRFCRHNGVDWGELREAIDQVREGGARGGSTISMQVVKNLFLWPSKSYLRKAVEIPLALLIEAAWSKPRILEIYLNIAEWGPGVFGAEAAARHHFRKSAATLSPREAALLAVSLPNPFDRQAGRPGPGTARLADNLQARMRRAADTAACAREPRNPR